MNQWLERHAQTLVGSLGRLWGQPFATLLTILVIGIALALPACLHVLVQNVRAAIAGGATRSHISVYMKHAATLDQARQAQKRITQRRDVEDVTLAEKAGALRDAMDHKDCAWLQKEVDLLGLVRKRGISG